MAVYTAPFNAVNVTVQQDFFELTVPTDAIVLIHAVELFNLSEIGDAQEEMLSILHRRGTSTTTSGSAGTVVTPLPVETGSSAFGGVIEANNTTKMATGTGTITLHRAESWNVRMPYLWLPTPEMRPILGPGVRYTVELATTPADVITMSGTLTFEELGG